MSDNHSILPIILPIIAIVIGFFLNEISQILRRRYGEKSALNEALCNLLTLRLWIVRTTTVMDDYCHRFGMQRIAAIHGLAIIESVFGIVENLANNFANSVRVAASVEPLIAYDIHSYEVVPLLLAHLRKSITEDNVGVDDAERASRQIEKQITTLVLPELDKALLRLAFRRSLLTWWRVKRIMRAQERIKYTEAQVELFKEQFGVSTQ